MSRSTCSWRIGARRVHDVVAFLATAEAAVGTIGPGSSAPVLLCTILFVAWGSGTGPALLAAALGALVLNFLLLQSSYSLTFQRRNLPPLAWDVARRAKKCAEHRKRPYKEPRKGLAVGQELRATIYSIPRWLPSPFRTAGQAFRTNPRSASLRHS